MGGIMNIPVVLEICFGLICFGLLVFLWYFFKAVEAQITVVTDALKGIREQLWKLEKSLR